jgi:beta-lysine 5,6-aminomutase alpha subunit
MGDVDFRPGGIIETRANDVLERAVAQLEHVAAIGLFTALAEGEFADVRRDPEGGRGRDGVVVKAADYCNPFLAELRAGRPSGPPAAPRRVVDQEPVAALEGRPA